tara:strand:- start:348 stop:746 length:399 start_codon:yes stop_codon:yes gene_type:complete
MTTEETTVTTLSLPLFIANRSNKRRWLTMNNYRNWHYQVSNDIKRKFKSNISHKLDFRFDGKIRIEYFYFAPDNRTRDLMNVISVVDKFFQDVMVENDCIISDDLSTVVEVNSCYMGVDKQNPRLDVMITKL